MNDGRSVLDLKVHPVLHRTKADLSCRGYTGTSLSHFTRFGNHVLNLLPLSNLFLTLISMILAWLLICNESAANVVPIHRNQGQLLAYDTQI